MDGNYVCTQCGSKASSKCARSRNVFITDDLVTMIGNRFQYEANRTLPKNEREAAYDTQEWTVTVKYRTWDHPNDMSAIRALINTLTAYPPETMKKALCWHSWELTEPTCEMGCCSRRSQEEALS